SVATVDSSGLAHTVGQGTSSISASYSGFSGSTTLTVTAAVLRSIAVTPKTPSIAKGDTQAFTVTGTYSDGHTATLTTGVSWTSDNTSVATVSAGAVHGTGQGQANVSATLSGVSGQAVVHVGPAVVSSVTVTATPTSVPAGDQVQMSATANFSDGTTQNVTGT